LSKKFYNLQKDYYDFKIDFDLKFWIHLWEWVYKFRCKNTTIPTWKSWGFRIILKIYWDKILPIMIYSKTEKSNVSKEEIKQALKNCL
jgi:hypothetical protein